MPADEAPHFFQDQRGHRVPPKTHAVGMTLFLISLGMLFGAGMLAYVVIRTTGVNRPEMGTVHVPGILWLSTFLLLVSSVTVHRAVVAVSREKQQAFRRWLVATLVLSIGFVICQAPGMLSLYQEHLPKHGAYEQAMVTAKLEAQGTRTAVVNADVDAAYPQEMHVLALVLIHALHVIGGLIPLFAVTLKAHEGGYDHEHMGPVRFTAWYWHFLDVVWLVMLAVIVVTA